MNIRNGDLSNSYVAVLFMTVVLAMFMPNAHAQLPRPENLQPADGSQVGATTVVTLSWNTVPNATWYNVRANNWSDNTNDRVDGNNCPDNPHYLCVNELTATSIAMRVSPGSSYGFWLHACNASGCGDVTVSNFSVAVAPPPPPPPQVTPPATITNLLPAGTILYPSNGMVQLTWSADPSAMTYYVRANDNTNPSPSHRAPQNNCPFSPHYFCVDGVTQNSISIPVEASHNYSWFLIGCNAVGCSNIPVEHFNVVAVPLVPLVAPTNLTTTCSPNGTQVTFSWNAVAGAEKYAPRFYYLEGGWYGPNDWMDDSYPLTTYTTNVVPGKPYAFWVHARRGNEFSGYAINWPFSCVPAKPANLIATCAPPPGDEVSISWNPLQGANMYAPRLNYVENDTNVNWYISSQDWMSDDYRATSLRVPITRGKQYRFWVHAGKDGVFSPLVESVSFSCNLDSGVLDPVVIAVPLDGGASVITHNMSKYTEAKIKELVIVADRSTKQKRPYEFATKGLMGERDRVVVTDSYIAWIGLTPTSGGYARSGELAGIWTLDPVGFPDGRFKNFEGINAAPSLPNYWPRNELLPGSVGAREDGGDYFWDSYSPPTEHSIGVVLPDFLGSMASSPVLLAHNYIQGASGSESNYSESLGNYSAQTGTLSFQTSGKMAGDNFYPTNERWGHRPSQSESRPGILSTITYRFSQSYIDSVWEFTPTHTFLANNVYAFVWLGHAPGFAGSYLPTDAKPVAGPCEPRMRGRIPLETYSPSLFVRGTGLDLNSVAISAPYAQLPSTGFCSTTEYVNYDINKVLDPLAKQDAALDVSADSNFSRRNLTFTLLANETDFPFNRLVAWTETRDGTQGIGMAKGPYDGTFSGLRYNLEGGRTYRAAFRLSTQ